MPFFKQKVLKGVLLILLSGFVEVVHVQLAYKRCVIIVAEIHWQYCLWELLDFLDDESLSAAGPGDDVLELAIIQDLVGF